MKPAKFRKSSGLRNPLGLRSTPPRLPARRPLPKSSSELQHPFANYRSGSPLQRFLGRAKVSFFGSGGGSGRSGGGKFRFHINPRAILIVLGGFLAAMGLGTLVVFAYYVRDIPNPNTLKVKAFDQSTQIVDRSGKPLFSFHGEQNRTVVKSDQISDFIKKSTIASEDANFYKHQGFSLRGIGRAVFVRLGLLTDRQAGGGSTITQQYIKNTLLTPEQDFDRKLKELVLAVEIEQMYSKEDILTGYLNIVPFGSNAYGVEAAAQTYFGKSAKDLTLAESATLTAVLPAPTYYSPYGNHLEDLFDRKNYVLDRMVKVGYISESEAAQAKLAAPSLANPAFKKARNSLVAPHFVFYVREKLIASLGTDSQEAEQLLDTAGYKVITTLDLPTQELAQKIVGEMGPQMVSKYQASNAALAAVDPKNGEILAMVGSIDYENSKSGNVNFANAKLQPGSSFKPIVYANAFSPPYKFHPGSITFDLKTNFGSDAKPYEPNNYNFQFRGPITNRNALAQSLNIPAIKNLQLAGIKDSIAMAQSLGITTLDPGADYGLSLVLGSGEVRPVEMAGAYAAFANGGKQTPIHPILRIEKDGKVVKDFTSEQPKKVLEPEVAWQMANVMSDNGARTPVFGPRSNLVLADRPVAAKSGTTENNRDAWTIGYTPSISVAVWVGNNEPRKTMVKGADGSIVAGPIWNRFMREYLQGKPVEQFNRPPGMQEVTLDLLSGKLPTDQSPEDQRIKEWLASWQIPKDQDNVHLKVKVNKENGRLATDLTPAELIEERVYCTVHSEIPENPKWEEPVKKWAEDPNNKMCNGGTPPTEKDDKYTEENKPTISFLSPSSGATVKGTFDIRVRVGGPQPITKVQFEVDGVAAGTVTEEPWEIEYDANSLSAGSHIIKATVTNDLNLTKTEEITVTKKTESSPTPTPTSGGDTTPPKSVSSISSTPGYKSLSQPIRLLWINPNDTDLVSVNIYMSTSTSELGTKVKTLTASPNSSGTAEFSGLDVDRYYFTIRPVDSSGNENTSTKQTDARMFP